MTSKLLTPVESLSLWLELQGVAKPRRELRLEPGSSPAFEYRDGLYYALDPMPALLGFSLHLLADARYPALELRGDIIDIQMANGRWVYRIVELWSEDETVVGRLVYAEDQGA